MSTGPADQLNQCSPLHASAGGWMEQEAAKVPERDGVPSEPDGVPLQGKWLWAGRQEAKGCLD
jgi:hypothetical protein